MSDYKKIVLEYEENFGKLPPKIWGVDYENEKYIELLEDAIEFNEELTTDKLSNEFYNNNKLDY